ncbi:uncharacterized protein LOC123712095 isoform X2 [Pieris brassicae]|uniref:uncharacterized protein LOC123712095 isoform X2 n=1 Tax=Pieris brassicae TaxID=7116 RepID=UPI001E65FC53|nr:uncharacterized protein LOC123712095 isoform X2 [Pieris brassicae]
MIYRTGILYILLILVLCDLISSSYLKRHKRKKGTREGETEQNVNEEERAHLKSNDDLDNNEKSEGIIENTHAEQSNQNSQDLDQNHSEAKQINENNSGKSQQLEDVSQNNGQDMSKAQITGNINDEDNNSKNDASNESENEKITEIHENNTLNHDENVQTRPFTVGDTFTPQELLPITQKLLSKVKNPGEGKGFVSSSENPEQLADKLFEAYFMTFKRIVTLSENDIDGLDALQALALSGEAVDNINDNLTEDVTEPGEIVFLRGQMVKMSSYPKKTKYKRIKLAQKLRKKRRLVVNKRRVGQDVKQKPKCHWRYECTSPTELDTCRIHTQCINDTKLTKAEYIEVPHKSDEHSKAVQDFRKMLGISLIDEEVEKILENRVIRLTIQPLKGGNRIERVESLSEYFNNIAMVQAKSTNALFVTPAEESRDNDNNGNEEPSPVGIETEPEGRKFLKVPKTTKPY